MKTKFKILILLLFTSSLFAQKPYYKQYTIDDGLAQSQVISICLDKMNRVWAGTYGGGVSIFDGVKFNNYTIDDGLVGNNILSLYRASNDNIIIGTENGISIYDGNKFISYLDTISEFDFNIWDIKEDINGAFLLATSKGVLKFKDGKYNKYELDSTIDQTFIFNIFLAKDEELWLGTKHKGAFLIKDNKITNFTTKDGLPNNTVRTFIQDSLGNIIAGTERGIAKLSSNGKFIKNKKSQTYKSSFLSDDNEMYLISNQGWFVNFATNNNDKISKNYSIEFTGTILNCITQDYEGNFWVGNQTGIIMFNKNSKFIEYNDIKKGGGDQVVYALFFSSRNILYYNEFQEKTFFAEINPKRNNKIDKDNNFYFYDNNLGANNIITNRIWSIREDYEKNIWFAAWGGISRLDTNGVFTNYSTRKLKKKSKYYKQIKEFTTTGFNSILIAKDSSIYFASYNGLVRYYNNKFFNLNNDFPELKRKTITNLIQDKQGRIFGVTKNNGFFIIDKDNIAFFNKDDGLIANKINYILQDNNNNYWLATGVGLVFFNGIKFINYSKKDGFASSNIYVLEIDNYNNLIVGTDKGFNKLNLTKYYNSDTLDIKYYGKAEGFTGLECNLNGIYKDYKGHIWFGTIKGVIEYIPENDFPNLIEPNTFLVDVAINNEKNNILEYCDSIDANTGLPLNLTLPYNARGLSFSFISTSKSVPSKVKFQYKLQADEDWIDVKNTNEIDFPYMLPDDEYTLYVRSSNDNGIWDSTPVEYKFVVTPPIWKTTWFITSAIILILILIIIFIKYREAKLKREKEILEEKVVERTQEVVKQKEIVEEKNKDITDSINYARNIQRALLPSEEFLDEKLKQSMVFFKPRDIVSGDFYWVSHKPNRTYVSAADSTGHGVPGAFMSMLGMAFLDEIVDSDNNLNAAQVLNKMRQNIIKSLKQKGKSGEARDGMDMGLCLLDWENKKLEFAGANNPLYLVSKDKEKYLLINNKEEQQMLPVLEGDNEYNLFEIKADKMPIGFYIKTDDFTNYTVELKNDDTIYMFSDGLPDQFGGPKGKKFKYKPFKRLLLSLEDYEMHEREKIMNDTFVDWVKGYEQIDDVIVLGIKFNL